MCVFALCLWWNVQIFCPLLRTVIFFNNFYWSIVDLQCCVSFRCTAKWISYWVIILIVEFWEFFIYSGYKSFVKCVISKYFFPDFGLPFQNFPDSIFQWAVDLNFDLIVHFLRVELLMSYLRNLCFNQGHKACHLCFLLEFL